MRNPILLTSVLAAASWSSASAQTLTFTASDVPSYTGARALVEADFDRNGWTDMAHANFGRDTVTVLLNRGSGGLSRAADVPVGRGPFGMVAADFNRDGLADLAVANADADSISVLLSRGDGSFTRTDHAAPGNPRAITAADMNRDGRIDLVYTSFAAGRVQVLDGDGAGGFIVGTSTAGHAQRPQGVAAADFNRDGRMDLAVAYASAGGLAILTTDSTGALVPRRVPGEENLNVVTTGDFNRDGWIDVAAASSGSSRMAVYLGGPGGVVHSATHVTGASPRGIAAADVDHDGAVDLMTANRYEHTVSVFLGRPTARGAFTAPLTFAAARGSRDIVVADFNQDGRADLATGNQDTAAATVLWNATAFKPAAFSLSRHLLPTGDPYSGSSGAVTPADINRNGVPDLVAGDQVILDGQVSRKISSAWVWECMPGDFDRDDRTDVVCRESTGWNQASIRVYINDGTGQFTSGAMLPVTGYGYTAVADMNRDGRADVVASLWNPSSQAAALEIWLNGGSGGWTRGSRTTLAAHAVAVAVADVSGDGKLDVLTGHSGELLSFTGNGAGGITGSSRYSLPDFGSGIATGDFNHDGRTDVAVAAWDDVRVYLTKASGELELAAIYDPEPHPLFEAYSYSLAAADMNRDGHLDIVANSQLAILPGVGDGTFRKPEAFSPYFPAFAVVDFDGDGLPDLITEDELILNTRDDVNDAPVLRPQEDLTIRYGWQFGEEDLELYAEGSDADLHRLRFEWRNDRGEVVSNGEWFALRLVPGTYRFNVTAFDERGASVTDDVSVTVLPQPEILIRSWWAWAGEPSTWRMIEDATAADGVRWWDPNRGAPKLNAAAASPTSYVTLEFVADPTQTYKLWVRGKAENDSWANDSIWLQFSGAADLHGAPVYRTGTTSGLAINLEECVHCGILGWGWRDERWGPALEGTPVLLRFPQGGTQYLVVQSREDGFSFDQIVLSAEKYRTSRPGAAKNDTTIVRYP